MKNNLVCQAGTVMWYRHTLSTQILRDWWHSSMDSYATNPLNRKFRMHWPWEQDRQMAIYNQSSASIQITSHPDLLMMPWDKNSGGKGRPKRVRDWCFSHLPGCGCVISHHCANPASKQVMRRTYGVPFDRRIVRSIESLRFDD